MRDHLPFALLSATREVQAMQDAHPVVVLAAFALLTLAICAGCLSFAEHNPARVTAYTAPFANPAYTLAAVEASPSLRPYIAPHIDPADAVWCEGANRWRCPVTRRFVKAPHRLPQH